MLRLVVGVADLTQERVGAVLAACAAAAPPVPFEATAGAPIDARYAALGLLSRAVGRAPTLLPAILRTRWSRVGAESRRRAAPLDRAGRLVGRLPGMRRALSRVRSWRDGTKMQLVRWTEMGRREQVESRALALDALTVLRENMIARVSESPDVKQVIREESEGIAVTAVAQLRDGSVRADDLAERAVGRLFGARRTRRSR